MLQLKTKKPPQSVVTEVSVLSLPQDTRVSCQQASSAGCGPAILRCQWVSGQCGIQLTRPHLLLMLLALCRTGQQAQIPLFTLHDF